MILDMGNKVRLAKLLYNWYRVLEELFHQAVASPREDKSAAEIACIHTRTDHGVRKPV
jgi:hypothetical protein